MKAGYTNPNHLTEVLNGQVTKTMIKIVVDIIIDIVVEIVVVVVVEIVVAFFLRIQATSPRCPTGR